MKYIRKLLRTATDVSGGAADPDKVEEIIESVDKKTDDKATDIPPETKYTEDDFKKLQESFDRKLQEQTIKAVDDALKKSKMTADEKVVYEQEQKNKALEEKEKELLKRELKADTAKLLAEKELPLEILDMVIGENSEDTSKRIENFKTTFNNAVQAAVEKRLAGKTPQGSNGGDSVESEKDRLRKIMGVGGK